jgi:hypothetical protein
MNTVRANMARALAGASAPILAAALAFSPLAGCMTADDAKNDSTGIDPFPKPIGQALIPLEKEFYARYRYAEFDTAGQAVLREDLPLHVYPKQPGIYAYAFEAGTSGYLLQQKDGNGNRDSAGVYIVGRFRDAGLFLDSAPVLWLPQAPKPGASWYLSPGRRTEVVSLDTSFWTEAVTSPYEDTAAYIRSGLQRQPTILFKETAGDTVTYYHFRRGMGCVAFQRAARGKLIASGSMYSFYGYGYATAGYLGD